MRPHRSAVVVSGGIVPRDVLNTVLVLVAVYLWVTTDCRDDPAERCTCTCPGCLCPVCPTSAPCGDCPDCDERELPPGRQVLSLLDTYPTGVLTPTSPSVYVVSQSPALTFMSLEGEGHVYRILRVLCRQSADRDAAVVDVGGTHAVGAFALFAARLGRRATVMEPTESILSEVMVSARLNGVEKLVTVDPSYAFESNTGVKSPATGKVVRSVPLDAVASRSRRILAVRVDAGGYDGLVLRGGREALRRGRISHLFVILRDPPPAITAHKLWPRADLKGVFIDLSADGLRGRLLRSACSQALGDSLERDDAVRTRYGIDAWVLPHRRPGLLAELLKRAGMKGAACPVWFSKH
eukprot:TRINITY_DN31071_c0_g1_i1.p1 TRINITY_DN31071_c0_g1~~TRINITY_DN31071_c0_g1_i1.p1  ORF type:complete len:352 (+),score=79.54 TRINITY_DN31071_c0_g1_i1:58-1113(+)